MFYLCLSLDEAHEVSCEILAASDTESDHAITVVTLPVQVRTVHV